MYKCTDCNKKYETIQDYCDCGNDNFEKIVEKEVETEQKEKAKEEPRETKVKPIPKKPLEKQELLSRIIFAVCIILSIFSWVFIGRDSKNPSENISKEQKAANRVENKSAVSVPDINSLWDNSLPSGNVNNAPVKKKTEQPVSQPIPPVTQQTPPTQKQVKNPPASPAPQAKPKNTPPQKLTPPPAQKQKPANNTEITKYKAALRQALFAGLPITSIHGIGKCAVEFSLSDSGKLLNRKFIYQSNNSSVNDAVYQMLMGLPQYYPPPNSYKGETIKMSLYFDNGYYEVNYLN